MDIFEIRLIFLCDLLVSEYIKTFVGIESVTYSAFMVGVSSNNTLKLFV